MISRIAWRRPAWSSDTTNSTPDRPRAQPNQEIAPGRAALAVGQFDRENAAAPVPADADRQQHRLAANHPGLAHALVACVHDQVRAGIVQPPARKPCQLLVELDVDRADRRGREAVAAQRAAPSGAPTAGLGARRAVMALTLRVDTPWTYISASAATSAFSEPW